MRLAHWQLFSNPQQGRGIEACQEEQASDAPSSLAVEAFAACMAASTDAAQLHSYTEGVFDDPSLGAELT
jgi:hypothetical protein